MTPAEHATAIEEAAVDYANACIRMYPYPTIVDAGRLSATKEALQAAIRAGVDAAHATPENIREGAPYDCPAFEAMAREFHVWGRASGALCAQFWLGGMRAAAPKP